MPTTRLLNDLIEVALKYGIIEQRGAWFTILDPMSGEVLQDKLQGQAAVCEFLDDSENIQVLSQVEFLIENMQTDY